MAQFFTEEYESCQHCHKGTFYERPLYAYQIANNADGRSSDISILIGVQIVCSQCQQVLKTINKDTQSTLLKRQDGDQSITTAKFKIG